MSAPRAEWRSAHAFAEVAEALGVATADVCAAWSLDGNQTRNVLYAPEGATGATLLVHAVLSRGGDGILRAVASKPTDLTVGSMMRR